MKTSGDHSSTMAVANQANRTFRVNILDQFCKVVTVSGGSPAKLVDFPLNGRQDSFIAWPVEVDHLHLLSHPCAFQPSIRISRFKAGAGHINKTAVYHDADRHSGNQRRCELMKV